MTDRVNDDPQLLADIARNTAGVLDLLSGVHPHLPRNWVQARSRGEPQALLADLRQVIKTDVEAINKLPDRQDRERRAAVSDATARGFQVSVDYTLLIFHPVISGVDVTVRASDRNASLSVRPHWDAATARFHYTIATEGGDDEHSVQELWQVSEALLAPHVFPHGPPYP